MKKFVAWLWYSSEDPKQVGLTIKGLALYALTEVTSILSEAGIVIPDTEIAGLIIKSVAIATAGLAILGFVRKLINTYSGKKIVTFTAEKKLSPISPKKKIVNKKKK